MDGVLVVGTSYFPISEIYYIESFPEFLRVHLKGSDAVFVDTFMSRETAETVLEKFNEIHTAYIEYALKYYLSTKDIGEK